MKLLNFLPFKSEYTFKNFNNTLNPRYRLRYILLFFILIMIPILISGIFYFSQSKKIILEKTKLLNLENSSQICRSIDRYLENLMDITQDIQADKIFINQVGNIISSYPDTGDNSESGNSILLKDIAIKIPAIQTNNGINLNSIYVLYNNRILKIYAKDNGNIESNTFSNQLWYSETVKNHLKPVLAGVGIRFLKDNTYKYVLSTAFSLNSYKNSKPAILLLDFDYNSFASLFENKAPFIYSDLFIIDNQNTVVFNKNLGLLTTKLDMKFDKPQYGTSKVNKDGKDMYVTYFTSSYSYWRVVSYIHIGKLFNGVFLTPGFLILIAIICIIIVYIFALILSKKLLKPFNQITMAVSGNGSNNFVVQNKATGSPSFIKNPESISNMDMLVHKIYSTQIQQKEAQLKSLQSQINPHFLYNTLESIRGAALYYGADTIAEMSKCLSLFFRYSISDNILVTIRDEIQHLDNYMAIQNFRHEDKFEIVYNLPENLYDYKILKLTLQPLVENAIKHGLEMRIGKGKITISAYRLDNLIKIQIQDNGTGIPEKKLEELKALLSNEYIDNVSTGNINTGIGVQNVNSRIKIYFGKKYGLSYSSSDSGTIAEITIPVVDS